MELEEFPILIVGGGVVGLTASLFLANQGVRSLLVERHPTTCIHPRARGVNGRTMELLRELGLDDAVREAGAALAPAIGIYSGATLKSVLEARGEGGWLMKKIRARGVRGQPSKKSPASACRCTQEELEPILLDAARARGVDARLATELVELTQDGDGTTSVILDRASGARREVRARYVIAADGARSPIRELLGIPRSGQSLRTHQMNVYFRADLRDLVRGREFSMCLIERPGMRGLFTSIDNRDRWVLHISYEPGLGQRPEDFTPERCAALIREASGIADLAVEIKGALPWGERRAHRRALPRGARVSRGRRGARDAAVGRLRRQHGHPGRAQPRLEARRDAPWGRGAAAARHVRARAAPGRGGGRGHLREHERRARPDDGQPIAAGDAVEHAQGLPVPERGLRVLVGGDRSRGRRGAGAGLE